MDAPESSPLLGPSNGRAYGQKSGAFALLGLLPSFWMSLRGDKLISKAIHSLKMAVALTLVFLLVLLDAPYRIFGNHAIWAIMTVIVVFEFTIGTFALADVYIYTVLCL
jgi:hypothetical protein